MYNSLQQIASNVGKKTFPVLQTCGVRKKRWHGGMCHLKLRCLLLLSNLKSMVPEAS